MPLPRLSQPRQRVPQGRVDIAHSPDWRSESVSPPGPSEGLGRAPPATQSPQAGGWEARPDRWLYREPPQDLGPADSSQSLSSLPGGLDCSGLQHPAAISWGLRAGGLSGEPRPQQEGSPKAQGPTIHRRRDPGGGQGTEPGHWRANPIHEAAKHPPAQARQPPQGSSNQMATFLTRLQSPPCRSGPQDLSVGSRGLGTPSPSQ